MLLILFFVIKHFLLRCNLHRVRKAIIIVILWHLFSGEEQGFKEYLVLLN